MSCVGCFLFTGLSRTERRESTYGHVQDTNPRVAFFSLTTLRDRSVVKTDAHEFGFKIKPLRRHPPVPATDRMIRIGQVAIAAGAVMRYAGIQKSRLVVHAVCQLGGNWPSRLSDLLA